MPQETKTAPEAPEAGAEERSLFGWDVDFADERAALDALEKAFDYRGDVTLHLADGREVMGYLFDRRRGASPDDSSVRIMTPDSDEPVRIVYRDIRRLVFSGKDAAHGKSFERWIEKYIEKKRAGERASIESDSLAD